MNSLRSAVTVGDAAGGGRVALRGEESGSNSEVGVQESQVRDDLHEPEFQPLGVECVDGARVQWDPSVGLALAVRSVASELAPCR